MKDRVLELTDIVEVIGERIALTRKGREMVGLCPFHDDHSPSLNVSPSKQIFKCWVCGSGGDVIKFVQLYERVEFRAALEQLARRAGLDARLTPEDSAARGARDHLRRAVDWARRVFQHGLLETPAGKTALEYARSRGLTDETIKKFGLGFAPDAWDNICNAARRSKVDFELLKQAGLVATAESGKTYDRFRNRLVFPIADPLGRPVAFGGRTLGDDQAKYLNSPETALFHKARVLYGFDVARDAMREKKRVIVVEGYMDAVLLHQHGFTNVVATLGTALTDGHVRLLRPLVDSIILCFDGDAAGQKAAERGVETAIRHDADVRVVVLEAGVDPADYVSQRGDEAFERVLSDAVDALQFRWEQTVRSIRQDSGHNKRATVEAFLDFVAAAGTGGGIDPIEQGLLVARVSELVSLPADSVYEYLARARARVRRRDATPAEEGEFEGGEYADFLRGVPAGLIAAVEQVFGVLLNDASCLGDMDDAFAQAAGHCDAWQRLYAIMTHIAREQGEFGKADVLRDCEDTVLLELVQCSLDRTGTDLDAAGALALATDRLKSELNAIRGRELGSRLGSDDQADAFASLVKSARGRNGSIAEAQSWRPVR